MKSILNRNKNKFMSACSGMRFAGMMAVAAVMLPVAIVALLSGCERNPELHLNYKGDVNVDLPVVELELNVFWDYTLELGTTYDWRSEWYYDWDDTDTELFGEIGYTKPSVFQLRRYFTGDTAYGTHTSVLSDMINGYTYSAPFDWGFWDLLVWNEVTTIDGVQSLRFDETTTLDYVTASTGQTMNTVRYQAPKYTRSFYQPEALFSAYSRGMEVNKDLEGFVYNADRNVWVRKLDMTLYPVTYIYLTQVIIHHNNGKITGVDGNANLSGMARTVNLNTGVTGDDAITVHYYVRFKKNCDMKGESVDIAGGRLMTFGMCNLNASRVGSSRNGVTRVDDGLHHYMDVTMQFSNGMDSTFVFDVTDQVQRRYKGGVLTVELDADTIKAPKRKGGSGFDAVVKDFEDGGTHEFEM
jgi:hypothetical protein